MAGRQTVGMPTLAYRMRKLDRAESARGIGAGRIWDELQSFFGAVLDQLFHDHHCPTHKLAEQTYVTLCELAVPSGPKESSVSAIEGPLELSNSTDELLADYVFLYYAVYYSCRNRSGKLIGILSRIPHRKLNLYLVS